MINDMADFLISCFKDGSFSKREARNIVNSPKFNMMDRMQTGHEAQALFDEFVESHYFDRIDITQEACKIFLKEVEKIEATK